MYKIVKRGGGLHKSFFATHPSVLVYNFWTLPPPNFLYTILTILQDDYFRVRVG